MLALKLQHWLRNSKYLLVFPRLGDPGHTGWDSVVGQSESGKGENHFPISPLYVHVVLTRSIRPGSFHLPFSDRAQGAYGR